MNRFLALGTRFSRASSCQIASSRTWVGATGGSRRLLGTELGSKGPEISGDKEEQFSSDTEGVDGKIAKFPSDAEEIAQGFKSVGSNKLNAETTHGTDDGRAEASAPGSAERTDVGKDKTKDPKVRMQRGGSFPSDAKLFVKRDSRKSKREQKLKSNSAQPKDEDGVVEELVAGRKERIPLYRTYRYRMRSADTRSWLINEMIRRTMSAVIRSGGVITKGERRLKTRSRVWCVNRSPFVHGKHKDHFWMRMRRILFSYKQDAYDALEEPNLRKSAFKIAEKLPGIVATRVNEKTPGVLALPEMYLKIQRIRHGARTPSNVRLRFAGGWPFPTTGVRGTGQPQKPNQQESQAKDQEHSAGNSGTS
ncbi:hypothetical protein NDN08_002922 [Rhodosorus marinus]|uniref:Small ribosomal subunit protein uS10 domain-containing protein n=1 Tax=Rhodosorus marinus TaxID=101924 RepID=A0AAV8UWK3_9RHOD|nr:hypothetical protein NDN08_002922 [Rhodosorus marinus]